MKVTRNIKTAVFGLVAAGALALGTTAQALTIEGGLGATGSGTAADPFVVSVSPVSGLFLDTINFDLGTDTHFNMTSTVNNIDFFGAAIFENNGDTEFVAPSANHFSVFLPDLGLTPFDYHLHPQGLNNGGGSYELTLWGSTAPVPVPAAVWLFGSGLAGVVGLARRKMSSATA